MAFVSDPDDLSSESEWHLKKAFQANGQTPLKVDILRADSSGDSVRATYKAWIYDPAEQPVGDDAKPRINWEEGMAGFFREMVFELKDGTPRRVLKPDEEWKHNWNSVRNEGSIDADSPDLDQEVAKEWTRLKEVLLRGGTPPSQPTKRHGSTR